MKIELDINIKKLIEQFIYMILTSMFLVGFAITLGILLGIIFSTYDFIVTICTNALLK